ncbi:transposase [Micromonospora sp. WMMD987]|uniref:transposase n=1 Tax=Micromonospora sp. WMMD987 TaxID=3016089 RepID=UPI00249ABBE6|nr:transposase [Micromonospora sp. WMMD987]WFE93053.1 transposase [Micromonospora sp. WMMD987]
MQPHQDVQPAPWQHTFATTFAWIAEHEPAYFQHLTWAETQQNHTCLAMFHAWADEQAAHTGVDQLRRSLATITLLQQHAGGQLDRDHLVVMLVDTVRPPWVDHPLAVAFGEVDPTLVAEFAQIDDMFALVARLAQVFAVDTGFTFALWSVAAEALAVEVAGAYLPYFAAACDEHLRQWYLTGPVAPPDLPGQPGDAAPDGGDQPTSRWLDYLDPDRFPQVLADCPDLAAGIADYNTQAYAFNLAGPYQEEYRSSVHDALARVLAWYAHRQPVILGRLQAFGGPQGQPADPATAHLLALAPQWEQLRQACEPLTAALEPDFTGYPPAQPLSVREQIAAAARARLSARQSRQDGPEPPEPVEAPTAVAVPRPPSGQSERGGQSTPGGITDEQWRQVEAILPVPDPRRSRLYDRRLIVEAIHHHRRTGCALTNLPERYPPARVVGRYRSTWERDGTMRLIEAILD